MVALHRLLVLAAGASLIAGLIVRLFRVPGFPVAPATFLHFTTTCAVLGIALMLLDIHAKMCEHEAPPSGARESQEAAGS
jgi:hypothetical protein